jgi:DNA-binding NtrC family response regulator
MRLGGDRKIPVNVRIVAAASRDLSYAVQEDKFRSDLFFRLNVLRLQIPALRQRQEDIPLLLDFFIRHFSDRHGLEPITLPDEYLKRLMTYSWPGNVRQLRNFAERLVMNCSLRCSNDTLEVMYRELIQYGVQPVNEKPAPQPSVTLKSRMKDQAQDTERAIILESLQHCRFNKNSAAKRLGISRTTLWRKMKEFGIE